MNYSNYALFLPYFFSSNHAVIFSLSSSNAYDLCKFLTLENNIEINFSKHHCDFCVAPAVCCSINQCLLQIQFRKYRCTSLQQIQILKKTNLLTYAIYRMVHNMQEKHANRAFREVFYHCAW